MTPTVNTERQTFTRKQALFAVVGIAILFAGSAIGFLYGRTIQNAPSLSNASNNQNYYGSTVAIGLCNPSECLFRVDGTVVGLGWIKGYYRLDTIKGAEENPDLISHCDRLIVTDGSQPLIDELKNTAQKGNTVNSIDPDGKLALNIGPIAIDATITRDIYNSTANKPISLQISRDYPEGKGAGPCTSFVQILRRY